MTPHSSAAPLAPSGESGGRSRPAREVRTGLGEEPVRTSTTAAWLRVYRAYLAAVHTTAAVRALHRYDQAAA